MRGRRLQSVFMMAALPLLAAGCSSRPASGQQAIDARTFFAGKTMTYIVATEPGGGYDTYGRLLARYIGKYLGLSRVVVKNVPGGAHLRGAHQINGARADGLTLGTFNSGLIYAQLLKTAAATLDLTQMTWIGKAGTDARVLVVSKASGFRSLEDIRRARRPLVVGSSGVGTQGYNDALLIAHALGLETRLVLGFASTDAQMSMMRGEIDAEFAALSSHRTFLRNGYGHALFRIGAADGEHAAIPDLEAADLSDESRALVELVRSQASLLRWTAGPPGIPADRVALLREAYMAALADPGLLEQAHKLQLPIVPMDGATLAAEIARLVSQPPQAAAQIAALLAKDRTTR